jgi:hypothetical protein
MYIDPIHAGPVALAHPKPSVGAPQARRFRPLHRFTHWWRGLDDLGGRTGDPMQLMLWSESWGRPYAASLGLVVLMNHLRKSRTKQLP